MENSSNLFSNKRERAVLCPLDCQPNVFQVPMKKGLPSQWHCLFDGTVIYDQLTACKQVKNRQIYMGEI